MTEQVVAGFSTMSSGLKDARHYHQWLFDLIKQDLFGRVVLECGTGNGIMTDFLLSSPARHVYSIDLDQDCLDQVKARMGSERLTTEKHDLNTNSIISSFVGRKVDAVVIFNVLEHLKDDVGVLNLLNHLLVPGGKVFIFVPAFQSLFGGMDTAAGHFRRYSRRDLASRLAQCNFLVEKNEYVNPLGFLGWWFTNKVLRERDLNSDSVNGQIKLFDRYALPVSLMMQSLTRYWFGQSVFVVAIKS